MSQPPLNILYIMVDQMRADCLSAVGHPVVKTPHLDQLAAEGVLFPQTFVQAAVCVPSRMCAYTGRYPHATRCPWNEVPLPADQKTMGHYFSEAGYRAALCGKVHYTPDPSTLAADDPGRLRPVHRVLPGLEDWEFNDGRGAGWLAHLRRQGYPEEVVKNAFAVQMPAVSEGRDHSAYPTFFRAEDSDTAFMTDRAMAFMTDATGDQPWFLHLSYFKPHLPIVAPAPYHAMYDPAASPLPNREAAELEHPHPLHIPYRTERNSITYDDEGVWRQRRATYYGLITEIDDHLGRLFDFMKARSLWDKTLIIFTSDHGEYVGDHWMFEKELFYDEAYRVPFIVRDPRPAADAARGTVCEAFVEGIDALPTMMEAAGLPPAAAIQGRSLVPWLHGGTPTEWRDAVHADWDFRFYWSPKLLNLPVNRCRAWMVRDREWKYWHFNGLPDVLFDLKHDPRERHNLADDPAYTEVIQRYRLKLLDWRMANEDQQYTAWTYSIRPGFGRNPFATAQ
jgi:arylsulfatase A-like enzyme